MRNILVVDDSTSMRRMVAFTLSEGGFTAIEAANGEEGLEKLRSERIDLVITDLNMPVMDGITFIRSVRAIPSMKGKPILMLTTDGLTTRKEEGKAAGATGWLVKPFEPAKLLQTIARVLPK